MNRSKLNFRERLYLLEVFKGLWLTSRHFFANMKKHLARQLGFTRIEKARSRFNTLKNAARSPLATAVATG